MFRFLLLREQNVTWQEQIRFTELLGTPFTDALSPNRKKHDKVPDPRIGVFSNDPVEGLRLQGTEGWHVDGNVVERPHMFTLIYCRSSNKNGPTLIVPLKEIVDMLSNDERDHLERIYFVSGVNSTIVHPLLYKDGKRNDDTIMIALGRLSGQYLEEQTYGSNREMSVEETQFVQDLIEAKILGSNQIYAHQYRPGDLIVLYNPSVSHIAGPGSQSSREVSGLRLMTRTTVRGENVPSVTSHIKYECSKIPPFESGYCVFSLKDSVYYPRVGVFDTQEHARKHCQRLNKHADLVVLPTVEWNDFVRDIITCTGVPHWLNAKNPTGNDVYWHGSTDKCNFALWDSESGQPNDHDMTEDCVIIGPHGHWFDLPCSGPKTKPGSDAGPVMTWEDGRRTMFNVYPLCGVSAEYLSKHDNVIWK